MGSTTNAQWRIRKACQAGPSATATAVRCAAAVMIAGRSSSSTGSAFTRHLPPGGIQGECRRHLGRLRLVTEIDEGEARRRVEPALEVARRLLDDDLERRPHVALEQVAAVGAAVTAADDDVPVQLSLLAAEGNYAAQRDTFHL